jgi:hypothetical protein
MNATFSGNDEVVNSSGATIDNMSFTETFVDFYKSFDFGLAVGLGGRIPLDKNRKWHLTAGVRFYYGLTNIVDPDAAILIGFADYQESNIFGLVFVGLDIPTKSKQ